MPPGFQGWRELLEAICAHDDQSAEWLNAARNAMYDQIKELVLAVQYMPSLPMWKWLCGDASVQRTCLDVCDGMCQSCCRMHCEGQICYWANRRFRPEPQNNDLGVDIASIRLAAGEVRTELEAMPEEPSCRLPAPLVILSYEKLLPEAPLGSPPVEESTTLCLRDLCVSADSTTTSWKWTSTPPLPPLPKVMLTQEDDTLSDRSSRHDNTRKYRVSNIYTSHNSRRSCCSCKSL